jgi:hypothetical protein
LKKYNHIVVKHIRLEREREGVAQMQRKNKIMPIAEKLNAQKKNVVIYAFKRNTKKKFFFSSFSHFFSISKFR